MNCVHNSLARSPLRFTRSLTTVPRHAPSATVTHIPRKMAGISTINIPLQLVLDFDGTFTRKDTMHLVAQAGYSHQSAPGRESQPTPWSEIVSAYMADFKAHANSYTPQAADRTSPNQEFAWLDGLEHIEESSFHRALDAGIFDHLTTAAMERAGKSALHDGHLQLRSGWHELATRIRRHNTTCLTVQPPIRILSVNWSAAFIKGVIQQASDERQMSEPLLQARDIYANEMPSIVEEQISSCGNGYPSTSGDRTIRTSGAKASLLHEFRRSTDDKGRSLLMYVGDSATDLGCLLNADFGIVVQDDPMASGQQELAETCQRIGVSIYPIAEALNQPGNDCETKLWSIRDFSEIVQWLDKNANA